MSLKSFEKKIDGHSVKTIAFAGREGFKIKAKLFKLIGPSLSSLGSIAPNRSGILNAEIKASTLGEMLSKLLEGIDEGDTLSFVFRLLAFTEVDGRPAWNETVFDEMFSGKFKLLYSILWFVLESNYGDFFGAGGIGSILRSAEAIPSE